MDRFVENNTRMVKSTNAPDNGEKRRTALKDIHNVTIHGDPPFPYVINKGPGPDENSFDENSQKFAGHRPITRKFAASMANRSPISQRSNQRDEEIGINRHNKASSLESSLNDFKGTLVQECTKTMEHPLLPMSEEIEEMVDVDLREDCDLKEAEMEDLVVEPVLNIDSLDFHNPLALADYVEDIYSFYRKAESSGCVHPDYMLNQVDVNEKMRAILIDWLIEVHYKFDLMDETLFLTVNLVDRFLSQQTVVRKKLQLVGVTALLIACKYEEIVVPVVEDLVLISDRAYTRQEVLDMEKLMINTLQFNLSFPTPYVFMKRFLKAAQSDKKLELLSFFMIELCLVEYEMLKFHPSLLAASAIYTAQCTLKGYKSWSKTSEFYTTYTEDQLSECSKLMVGFHEKAGKGKLTGVLKKYSTSKFGYAAKSQPAHFLMS